MEAMDGGYEHEVWAPHPRLRPYVTSYTGYRVSGIEPGTHAGLPSASLTVIVAFDEPLSVGMASDGSDQDKYWAMLGGLHASPAHVRHQGSQYGVQLAITPRGAAALFGLPAAELAKQIAHLDQIRPDLAVELIDRLSTASTWRARWAALDDLFLRVLQVDAALPAELEKAWALLRASHGAASVDALAHEVGWSRRHFTNKFRDTFGLTPKVMGRVLRFERAQRMMRLPTRPSLSSVAAACGYADQAHMTREWQEFAGASPAAWIRDEALQPAVENDIEPT